MNFNTEVLPTNPAGGAKEAAAELHQDISDDLSYSGIFSLLPKKYYDYIRPLDPNNIFFKDWESIQANILFVGEVTSAGAEEFIFEGKLFDVKGARFISGKRYQVARKLLRLAAHRMADEIVKVLSGEKAIFTTRIVFVSNRDGNDELYMMDYDGQNQTRLTFNTIRDYMPAWSADGKRIAYTSYKNLPPASPARQATCGMYTKLPSGIMNSPSAPTICVRRVKPASCATSPKNSRTTACARSSTLGMTRLTPPPVPT